MSFSSQHVSSERIYPKHDLPPINSIYPDPKPIDFALIEMLLAGHLEQLNKAFYDLMERGRVIDQKYGGGGDTCVRDAMLAHRQCRTTYQILAQMSVPRGAPKRDFAYPRREASGGAME